MPELKLRPPEENRCHVRQAQEIGPSGPEKKEQANSAGFCP